MTEPKKILLIDDDREFRETLSETINLYEEFHCTAMRAPAEALDHLRTEKVDLILLDIDLPNMDGREVCRRLRRENVSCPIIMLTGLDGEADIILGFESGANDYVVKPFRFGILLARIRAHMRSFEKNEDATFKVGHYTFHPMNKMLVDKQGRKVRLTEREAAIVRYLRHKNSGSVSRDDLLEEVWGYKSGVTTHTVETHIYRIRQKIEKDPSRAEILVTEGRGYRLVS